MINVGAGAGAYEPTDRYVAAVEPSATMRAQRPVGLAPAIDAVAEALPFDDDSFDAAMAVITVHQWSDLEQGLRELCRVGRVLDDGVVERAVEALRRDLADGTWDERHGHLRGRPWFDGALRLVVARPRS